MNRKITARELAEELLKNPDDIVCKNSDNFEQGDSLVLLSSPKPWRFEGEIKKENFMDAFDGESYSKDTVIMAKEGSINFVKI